jgi:hypothetical protein
MNVMDGRHRQPRRPVYAFGLGAGALFALSALLVSGCAAHPRGPTARTGVGRAADVALVRYSSCEDALRSLRATAAKAAASAGFSAGADTAAAAGGATPQGAGYSASAGDVSRAGEPARAPAAASQAGAGQVSGEAVAGSYSGTNTAEAGVDGPDLAKTDGRRIVTVVGGVLRVVDAQTYQLTGVLDLAGTGSLDGAMPADLLLAGDHALVLFNQPYPAEVVPVPGAPKMSPPAVDGPGSVGSNSSGPVSSGSVSSGGGPANSVPAGAGGSSGGGQAGQPPITGPFLRLIDLSSGAPRILSEYTIDGALVDARQVGSVARVVVHSAPRPAFPSGLTGSAPQGTAADRAVVASAGIRAWLPRYAMTDGYVRRTGQVDCASVRHPAATYSGTSMLTVLTFDLAANTLGDGQPLTIVADGDTVYSNGSSLYIANDHQWTTSTAGPQQYTGLYKFDISGPGRPVYLASGTVPGWLLGPPGMTQYALSEWDGALRAATSTSGAWAGEGGQPAQNAVYVLEQAGDQLVTVGKVGGLGQGEQIYAVRFAGPLGYVVTFRQTDPLYTIDLSDPAQPRVEGELELRGYSTYLDPIDATRVMGVGQDANALGQMEGTQVSLFDVSDLSTPTRLAAFNLPFGHSEAEFDPHAFLYWQASRLLVVPVQLPSLITPEAGSGTAVQENPAPSWPASEAVVLRVGHHSLTEVDTITHPATADVPAGSQIRRSLVIGDTLWTLSDSGLKANELTTLAPQGWVPFD